MQGKESIDLDDLLLCLSGKPLDNGRTLSECNVRPQSSLELLPRLRGGMRLQFTNANGKQIVINFENSDTELTLSRKFLIGQQLAVTHSLNCAPDHPHPFVV